MKKVPLPFRVPFKHQRICMFFTEDEQACTLLKIGWNYFCCADRGRAMTVQEESDCLDWMAMEMMKLRKDIGK